MDLTDAGVLEESYRLQGATCLTTFLDWIKSLLLVGYGLLFIHCGAAYCLDLVILDAYLAQVLGDLVEFVEHAEDFELSESHAIGITVVKSSDVIVLQSTRWLLRDPNLT